MALPVGVTTCAVNVGPLGDFAGDAHAFTVEWQPVLDGKSEARNVESITWSATGQALASFIEKTTEITAGNSATLLLPHVDQDGFVDGTGGGVKMWGYRVKVRAQDSDHKTYTKTKYIQPLVGQTTLDFDMVPDGKIAAGITTPRAVVTSVNGETGEVIVPSAGDVSEALSAAEAAQATADAAAPQTALDDLATVVDGKADTTALATKADLVAGKVPSAQIPSIALTNGQAVANRAAMLALTDVQPGDFVSITSGADKGTYVLRDADPSIFGSWLPLSVPTDVVQTVNGQNGAVVLGKNDVGLTNVDNTSDANKPVSIAQAAADAVKVDATAAGKERLAIVENSKLWPFRAALGRRDTDLVNVGILGASNTEGAFVGAFDRTLGSRLATLLRKRFPTKGDPAGGRGFIGVPSKELVTSPQFVSGMWPQVYTGGLFDPPSNGAASAFDLGAKHMCWYTNSGTGSPKVVHTLAAPVTSFEIHHAGGPAGGATAGYYKIDGGAAVPFSTLNIGITPVIGGPANTSIEVGWNAAGFLIFTGIREYAGDETKGIQVHNFGHSGMKIADWQDGYAVANSWRAHLASFNLDLLILHDLAANDAFSGMTPAQVKTALIGFIAVLRSGGITCPIVLSALFDPSGGAALGSPWSTYATAMREIADADATVIFVDHSVRMPSTAVTDTLALYSTVDKVHARADGAINQWMASTYDAVLAAA